MQDKKTVKQTATNASPMSKDFQTPKRPGCSRYGGVINGDSPGDVEPSQDIIWDSTSPTPANTGSGRRTNRVVEISDIVNRIVPKDVKQKATESPLLQWIGDSAVPCTPDVPKPRMRKKSSRQSTVDDLMKLARQFDQNMQQDRENLDQPNAIHNNLTSKTKLTSSSPGNVKDLKLPSSSQQVEAELHALFDSSTQKFSGRLSQGSSVSACSQEKQPGTPASAQPRQPELKSAEKSGPAANAAATEGKVFCGFSANAGDDFDDDWENDDLLNDSFVLAMTQNPAQQHDTNSKSTSSSTQSSSVCKSAAITNSAHQPLNLHSMPSCSALQSECPKPKTTNRSTFKLQSNPFLAFSKTISKSSVPILQPNTKTADLKPVQSTKALSDSRPNKILNAQKISVAASSVKDISDSLWDDGDDDALLYEVCDSVERISNSQPQQVSLSKSQEKLSIASDGQKKPSVPLPIDAARSTSAAGASANRPSLCAFVRSNSLPGTSREAVNYRGWNVPMKGASSKCPGMSQSLPGSHRSLGTLNPLWDSSGTFQASSVNADTTPHTATARPPQNSKSHHTAFKRNVSDSAVICNKVFVTSQMTAKCSAAEIERKKQEALAKRRQRMQNCPKNIVD